MYVVKISAKVNYSAINLSKHHSAAKIQTKDAAVDDIPLFLKKLAHQYSTIKADCAYLLGVKLALLFRCMTWV